MIITEKNTPTITEQKQILENCVHKLEEVDSCIQSMYPVLSTEYSLSDLSKEELMAHEFYDDLVSVFCSLGGMLLEVVRKGVRHG